MGCYRYMLLTLYTIVFGGELCPWWTVCFIRIIGKFLFDLFIRLMFNLIFFLIFTVRLLICMCWFRIDQASLLLFCCHEIPENSTAVVPSSSVTNKEVKEKFKNFKIHKKNFPDVHRWTRKKPRIFKSSCITKKFGKIVQIIKVWQRGIGQECQLSYIQNQEI